MSTTTCTAAAEDAFVVALPARLASGELPALRERIETLRASGVPILLDASAVTFVDSAGVQFLVLCRCAAGLREYPLALLNRGEALSEALHDIGAADLFGP